MNNGIAGFFRQVQPVENISGHKRMAAVLAPPAPAAVIFVLELRKALAALFDHFGEFAFVDVGFVAATNRFECVSKWF